MSFEHPITVRHDPRHGINKASHAGLIPGGLTTSYWAPKHGVVGFSLTLRPGAQLYGVRRNRGIILTPNRKRIYRWLHRLSPEVMPNLFAQIIARLKRSA